jgi:ribonuclease P protein subunit RPR2
MAKAKAPKGNGGVTNKALHSRVSYLYQAAAYLATREQRSAENVAVYSKETTTGTLFDAENLAGSTGDGQRVLLQPSSQRLLSDLRSVSLKAQIRLSPAMKHSICKQCDTMLIDGSTCMSEVENKSKGGRKPWADTLVRKCQNCGSERRFPLLAERQARRPHRSQKDLQMKGS